MVFRRYLWMFEELKEAYGLKGLYRSWFEKAKTKKEIKVIKEDLEAFYRKVEKQRTPPS